MQKKFQVCFKTGLDPAEMIQSHTENQIIGISKVLYKCDNFNVSIIYLIQARHLAMTL